MYDMQMKENKSEAQTCAGEVMASGFWDSEGILLVEYLNRGDTITSHRYVLTLR